MSRLFAFFFLLFLAPAIKAAIPDSTAVYEMKAVRIGINTFTFRNFLAGTDSLNKTNQLRYYLGQDHTYNSTLPESRFTREDYFANLNHSWNFRQNWWLEEHVLYQHNRASQTETGSFTEHVRFSPQLLPDWQLQTSVFAGIRRDARSQRTDTGPEYGGTLLAGWSQPADLESASGTILFSRANLSPRTFQRLIADARYDKQFSSFAAIGLRSEYRQNRTEDYTGNNVQRIQSDTLALYFTGTYNITNALVFRSSNRLALPERTFSYRPLTEKTAAIPDSRYDQFELETLQEMLYQTQKLRGNLQFGYRERNRRYATSKDLLKDLLQNTTSWGAGLTWLFTEKHSISTQNQGELLRVNTPSEDNNEDRDEVFYESRLQFTSRWRPNFRTNFGLVGAYKQYVFIKAAQSAENYTERSLFYEPGFVWAPSKFSWDAQMQLQANYQVRSLLSEQLKNRANRTFNQTHLFRYDLSKTLALQLEYYRRENRLGLLNWERFSESPLDTTISNTLALFAKKYVAGKKIHSSFRGGYRYFEQRIRSKAGLSLPGETPELIYLHQVTRQHGPEVSYEGRTQKNMRIYASLWMQRLHTFKTYREAGIPYLGSTFTPEELAANQKNWYPYFDVSVHWPLRFSRYGR
ncbi:hypothetical protein [Adhaeribacter terreus]|uniref:Outer membrane beta-barrel protein n=1 Tax=Adhaeribacter terreus TaxID=529703 RepID=A0ABW0ECX5_9BACT